MLSSLHPSTKLAAVPERSNEQTSAMVISQLVRIRGTMRERTTGEASALRYARRGAQVLDHVGVDASRDLAAARDSTGLTCDSCSRSGGDCLLTSLTLVFYRFKQLCYAGSPWLEHS